MTCGPSKFNDSLVRGLARTNAAVCLLCAGYKSSVCPETKRPIPLHVRGIEPCPKDKHMPKTGVLARYGTTHAGLPFLERVFLFYRYMPQDDMPAFVNSFPGCGCVVPLKAATLRAQLWVLKRLRRRPRAKAWTVLFVLLVLMVLLSKGAF